MNFSNLKHFINFNDLKPTMNFNEKLMSSKIMANEKYSHYNKIVFTFAFIT
jgi:hypothetical protein